MTVRVPAPKGTVTPPGRPGPATRRPTGLARIGAATVIGPASIIRTA